MTKTPTFIHYLEKDSFFYRIGLLPKLIFFLIMNTVAICNKLYLYNFFIIFFLVFIILKLDFFKTNTKILKAISISSFGILIFWLVLSEVPGSIEYIIFPWGSYISNNTFSYALLALSKWLLFLSSGMLLMATVSEIEVVNFLFKLQVKKKIIITITLAFNTVSSLIKDIPKTKLILECRGFRDDSLFKKIKMLFFIGVILSINSMKNIININQEYFFKINILKMDVEKLECVI